MEPPGPSGGKLPPPKEKHSKIYRLGIPNRLWESEERKSNHPVIVAIATRLELVQAASCIYLAYKKTEFSGADLETIKAAIKKYYESGHVPWSVFVYYAKLFPEMHPNLQFKSSKMPKQKKPHKKTKSRRRV